MPEYRHLNIMEIGFVLNKEYWGKGIMAKAVKTALNCCFGKWNLDAVACAHFEENRQSQSVIEKCGFSFVKAVPFHSEPLNKMLMSFKFLKYKPEIISRNTVSVEGNL